MNRFIWFFITSSYISYHTPYNILSHSSHTVLTSDIPFRSIPQAHAAALMVRCALVFDTKAIDEVGHFCGTPTSSPSLSCPSPSSLPQPPPLSLPLSPHSLSPSLSPSPYKIHPSNRHNHQQIIPVGLCRSGGLVLATQREKGYQPPTSNSFGSPDNTTNNNTITNNSVAKVVPGRKGRNNNAGSFATPGVKTIH